MNANDRSKRALEIISREAAQFISEEAGHDSFITVIRAQSADKGARVMVFVSIFPEEKIRPALAFLERQREAFSNHLKTHSRLRPLPRIDFLLDNREETGAPIAELTKN